MAGVRGQGRGNGHALKSGTKSLLALVQRSQDPTHPVLRLIATKAEGYMADRGGPEGLSLAEQDVLKHASALAFLADLHLTKILNARGRPRRMGALKFHGLTLGYSRIVEAHNRLVASVGLERRARPVDDPRALAAFIQSLPMNEAPKGDATP